MKNGFNLIVFKLFELQIGLFPIYVLILRSVVYFLLTTNQLKFFGMENRDMS